MSYGGVLGTEDGDVLARFLGEATGQTSSHRAEATGVLAGAMILTHLAIYGNINLHRLSVTVCCDNLSVIKRLHERQGYEKVYPNATLRPDWDLIEETHHCYKAIQLHQITYEWVKGHQDSISSDDPLSVQSTYNILADALAAEVIPSTTESTTITDLFRRYRMHARCQGRQHTRELPMNVAPNRCRRGPLQLPHAKTWVGSSSFGQHRLGNIPHGRQNLRIHRSPFAEIGPRSIAVSETHRQISTLDIAPMPLL